MTKVTCTQQLSFLAISQEMAETMDRDEKQKTQGIQYWIMALAFIKQAKE